VLYEDWFMRYMQERERASFFVSWLLKLQDRGVRLVNPPHAASVLQYKPFQLHALRAVGARVPITCTVEPGLAWAWAHEDATIGRRTQPSSSRVGRSLQFKDTRNFRIRTPRAAPFHPMAGRRRVDPARGSRSRGSTCPRRPPQRQLPVHQAGIRACECRFSA
jgi:hypothetical protein